MMLKAQLDGVTVYASITNREGETELVEVGKVLARGVDLEKIKMDPDVTKEEEDNGRTPLTSQHVNIAKELSDKERTQLLLLLNEYRGCFALNLKELGLANCTKMVIISKPGSQPVVSKPYKAGWKEREEIQKIVDDWKQNGIVEETKSP